MKKKILIGVVLLLVIIQFFRIDKTNPKVVLENDFITISNPPGDIAAILKTSCYDCHSNETTYPWYTNVSPIAWWVKHHINEAREELNFSEWGTFKEKRKKHKLEECIEMVEENEMPLESYLIPHTEAKLTEVQKTELLSWLKAEFKGENKTEHSWADLIDGKKWQANIETTEGIDRMRALLKSGKNETDITILNKIGEDVFSELKTIFAKCTMKGLEHEMLHQYLQPNIVNINSLKEVPNVNDAQDIIMLLERNFNSYHNFFESVETK